MGERPDTFVELFAVASWAEHLQQHETRLTAADQEIENLAFSFVSRPARAVHLLPAVAEAPTVD